MDLEAILTTVLAPSASASVVVFLSKSLLRLWLDKDLETHRANLARQSAEEVEKLRPQLGQVAMEHEVRFTRLHVDFQNSHHRENCVSVRRAWS